MLTKTEAWCTAVVLDWNLPATLWLFRDRIRAGEPREPAFDELIMYWSDLCYPPRQQFTAAPNKKGEGK